jgi:hypothetical protein
MAPLSSSPERSSSTTSKSTRRHPARFCSRSRIAWRVEVGRVGASHLPDQPPAGVALLARHRPISKHFVGAERKSAPASPYLVLRNGGGTRAVGGRPYCSARGSSSGCPDVGPACSVGEDRDACKRPDGSKRKSRSRRRSVALGTSCSSAPPTSTDCSIRDGPVVSPAAATLLS